MSQIKTYEDACKQLQIDPAALPDVSMLPAKHQKAITAFAKLVIIAEALNGGWIPDWKNDDEYKYYPWFDMNPDADDDKAGLGLSYLDYDYSFSNSIVGSRLCFRTDELARYAGQQFIQLYADYFLL